ncbi:hypothetical protein HanRHA438_Chr15g0702901 [Helianthus annuus]|nr:hypothetical protein HanRHA438_Chr15g0702901 [Helianthus annuus]
MRRMLADMKCYKNHQPDRRSESWRKLMCVCVCVFTFKCVNCKDWIFSRLECSWINTLFKKCNKEAIQIQI